MLLTVTFLAWAAEPELDERYVTCHSRALDQP
jgi:hypothetical protein